MLPQFVDTHSFNSFYFLNTEHVDDFPMFLFTPLFSCVSLITILNLWFHFSLSFWIMKWPCFWADFMHLFWNTVTSCSTNHLVQLPFSCHLHDVLFSAANWDRSPTRSDWNLMLLPDHWKSNYLPEEVADSYIASLFPLKEQHEYRHSQKKDPSLHTFYISVFTRPF